MIDILQIRQKKQDAIDIVYLSDRLDTNTSLEADETFKRLIAYGGLQIVLNLENLDYISSSGLRVIITAMRNVKKCTAT
jgi:anti-sigma B factor antagonist